MPEQAPSGYCVGCLAPIEDDERLCEGCQYEEYEGFDDDEEVLDA